MPPPPVAAPPRLAADVAKPLTLSDPAKAMLTPGLPVRAYFERLAAQPDRAADAMKFLAAALPKREAVWWGLCCLKSALKPPLPEPAVKALAAVEAWVKSPTEETRRAAGEAADAAGRDTPAGCLASAACWSGGSMAPVNQPAVPPPEHLTALTLAAALLLAATAEPQILAATQTSFLMLGQKVASGQLKW